MTVFITSALSIPISTESYLVSGSHKNADVSTVSFDIDDCW
ncbi:hypothetical protein VCRA2130O400_460030 [Vibrio crassostreae]|nr:hypothetical protein VCRA2119O385_30310 [Vibrio crassostreae]CAK3969908.1 hypothetical protein VCRA2130O400_460030 [Vibrio crassostreae]